MTDSIEEAEKYLQGRLKFVSKKFREPGNTDEEIKNMESKRKRTEKGELKVKKAEAHALNMEYLINEVKSHTTSTITKASTITKDIVNDEKHSEVEIF